MIEEFEEVCLECGHRKNYHDGAGCNDQLPDGSPCPCRVCVDMPGSEPTELPDIKHNEEMLYCVGCGGAVVKSKPGQVLAIACICGANAPILHTKDGNWAPPASLVMATGARLPHLEYYLGFSEHQSALKTEVTRMLRAMGAISYTECPDTHCRESFERSKKHHREWMQRHSV